MEPTCEEHEENYRKLNPSTYIIHPYPSNLPYIPYILSGFPLELPIYRPKAAVMFNQISEILNNEYTESKTPFINSLLSGI